ncbi:TetR/AcrR family transcriptional regulator [Kribbella turkmenica]|uniref:TetR/AcrR family transcriptional regulator n=1 Tax=Kribbella turkmenica TaxID=2530375 RepID=A0A4R4WB59_9ACTN|nr:TetR/AcrR family transcriptional regulator [Kribbella turkmenica]TDD16022.1 TetR/AcrR family transcriptional regulator [Kribbella turkmenica]
MARPREFSDAAVIDAAMELFWEKGYEATTTQDLCERTGLGRGSLYNAFGSKHALYEESIKRYAETRAALQLQELAPSGGSVRDRLRDLMIAMIERDLEDPGRRGCLALNAAGETAGRSGEVTSLVHRQFRDLEEALAALIAVGQRTGELSTSLSPLQAARMFQSAYYGLRVLAKVTDDRRALLDVVDGTVAAL